jgi:hypothetical protein
MPIAVVLGATLKCSCGSTSSKLIVTSQKDFLIGNKLAATIQDHAPVTNIPPFGICSVLTAEAAGVPTPCSPAIPAPWAPGSTSPVQVGNIPGLLSTDELACTIPGVITVEDPGQDSTSDT